MITFSGSDYVNLKNEKAFAFSMENTSFSNITGSGCFGFSGALNKSFNFKFIKGSIVDAENNLFYNYDRNEAFNLSGVVDQARYAYYVDGALYKKAGTRSNYKIQNFFVETTGVDMTTDLNVYAREPRKISVTFPRRTDLSGVATGTISNASSTFALDVFTGSVDNSSEFVLKSIEKTGHLTVNNSINFVLESKSGTFGETYDLALLFNTSAGNLNIPQRTTTVALTPTDLSELDVVVDVYDSGEGTALSYDTGIFSFNNVKQTATGSGVAGDDYHVFLKYKDGYSGINTGWAGSFSITNGGSGYAGNAFGLNSSIGTEASGFLLSNHTGTISGAVTGLSVDQLGRNYSGASAPTINVLPILGTTGNILSSGTGLAITFNRVSYTKKFWSGWQLATGTTATGAFTDVTSKNQSLTAFSGVAINQDFFIRVKSKNYYDSMIQRADLIVSGVSNGKQFSRTLTGVA
tara:strand:+ start:5 stop:1396 length:1392 start_codon:yes stop_codon:yes gene_type:complete